LEVRCRRLPGNARYSKAGTGQVFFQSFSCYEKKIEKPLDIISTMCYNEYTKRTRTVQKTRKGTTMTKASLTAIYNALIAANFSDETAMAELEKEIHRGEAEKAAKVAMYDAAKTAVLNALAIANTPVTVAELYEECKDELPRGFTKAQVQYGLTHYWTAEVEKTEGKVNTYKVRA